MELLSNYFSTDHGTAFSDALPELRKQIGSKPFKPLLSNYGVAGNTFRAYRGWAVQPSKVYRQWAERVCAKLDIPELEQQLGYEEGFRVWHTALADSLQQHWINTQGDALSFAHQHKLIDLFVKWLSTHDLGSPSLSQSITLRAYCALDSQTLSKLNECLSMALPLSKPSMGDVHSKHTYAFCQTLIDRFAGNFGGSRLLFDFFAWRRGG